VASAPSEVQRTEELLWEAVRALYGPSAGRKVEAAAAVVQALGAYRAAVEQSTRLSRQLAARASATPVAV
jgi:hypothetical protein